MGRTFTTKIHRHPTHGCLAAAAAADGGNSAVDYRLIVFRVTTANYDAMRGRDRGSEEISVLLRHCIDVGNERLKKYMGVLTLQPFWGMLRSTSKAYRRQISLRRYSGALLTCSCTQHNAVPHKFVQL